MSATYISILASSLPGFLPPLARPSPPSSHPQRCFAARPRPAPLDRTASRQSGSTGGRSEAGRYPLPAAPTAPPPTTQKPRLSPPSPLPFSRRFPPFREGWLRALALFLLRPPSSSLFAPPPLQTTTAIPPPTTYHLLTTNKLPFPPAWVVVLCMHMRRAPFDNNVINRCSLLSLFAAPQCRPAPVPPVASSIYLLSLCALQRAACVAQHTRSLSV